MFPENHLRKLIQTRVSCHFHKNCDDGLGLNINHVNYKKTHHFWQLQMCIFWNVLSMKNVNCGHIKHVIYRCLNVLQNLPSVLPCVWIYMKCIHRNSFYQSFKHKWVSNFFDNVTGVRGQLKTTSRNILASDY